MRRGILLLSTILLALAVVPAATAVKPKHDPIPPDADQTLAACGFPVLVHVDGPEISSMFFDKEYNQVKQIERFPGQTATLTNLDTGKSITVSDSGSSQARLGRDGSLTVSIMGHGPVPDFVSDEPGLWYLDGGRVQFVVDADDNLTSLTIMGTVLNLCDQLAS